MSENKKKETSPENVRVGVFICDCGSNIAGHLDCTSVTEYAADLPGVVYAKENLYTCSESGIVEIKDAIKEHDLNRVVVASCSPRTHHPLFSGSCADLQEKVDPYLRPLYDALEDMMPPSRVQRGIAERTIEIAPLAYMRGRTLSDAFVILDEAQNATAAQMKMFLTRIGVNSRVVITGDKTQIDLPRSQVSGLIQVEEILKQVKGIEFVYLDDRDVTRHRLVKQIVRAYAAADERRDGGRDDEAP